MKFNLLSIVTLLILLTACGSEEANQENTQNEEGLEESAQEETSNTSDQPIPGSINPEDYWNDLEYDDFARNPDENNGKRTNMVGNVTQVLNDVEDEFTMFLHSQNVSNKNSFFFIKTESLAERILEGDEVRFYAVGAGEYTYETVQGISRTVPLFYIHDYEIYK